MDKQKIWNQNNYSIEYPHVPNYVRVSDNHTGAKEWDRFHKKERTSRVNLRLYADKKRWTEEERQYIKENFIDNRNMKILQLAAHFGVTKNSLYNQIQYIREQHRFKRTLLLEAVK